MNAIIFPQNSFGLAPKIFNTINMVFALGKVHRIVDTFWIDFTGNNGHKRVGFGIQPLYLQ